VSSRTTGTAIDSRALLGEVPIWSAEERALYWVDIRAPALHRFDSQTGSDRAWSLPEAIGAVAFDARGGLLVALASGLYRFDPASEGLILEAPIESDINTSRLNDGRCDRQGRFWVGSMDRSTPESRGSFYRYDPDRAVTRLFGDVQIPNGIAFSPDGGQMYFWDTPTRKLRVFDLDTETGAIGNERVLAEAEPSGNPDGAVTDAEGGLWVAHFGGWRITRYLPDGRIERTVEVPVQDPTACCFGGPDLKTLYVTSAHINLDEAALKRGPLAAGLFAVDTDFLGLAEPAFGQKSDNSPLLLRRRLE
jgi:L-arabinonolactonase